METDPLLCALCLRELAASASVMQVDGGPVKSAPGAKHLQGWLEWALNSGAPVVINRNELCTLHAVTLVRGTATCIGHIDQLLADHPRTFC